ncbi:DUF6088 family protein [Anaerobium acetethylicum]|uniref:Transcriptional regulator, AbiEi antitoxin, Type IV TA system n=1 Tax=Anaerobium acetethylicum TaxID=1619234 RepID=A0A1D3TYH0_9FIRM|nr:DUF6088 family protein [Anaerobium acetethylicum]SCP99496.1 Transcriptional regulator, AbiEi antitoxin, Type IV TA system [Anaerobium acetethylicum]
MERPKYNQAIIDRINEMADGTIFITSDFADIATVPAINMALARLMEENKIKRIMRGVYEKPRYSKLLNEFVATDTEKVAYAIARNYNWSIAPAGDTALNLLKLSTQVPAVWLYVSDGPYKEYKYDDIKIKFKHISNKETSGLSYITALTIQAIRAIGKGKVTEREIDILKSVLTDNDKRKIMEEAKGTTAWIYDVIKKIIRERLQGEMNG